MYHIKKDKRSEASARKIVETFEKILFKHSFEDITVVEICQEAGIARSTFYRLFDNLQDVLDYTCYLLGRSPLNLLEQGKFKTVREFALYFMDEYRKHFPLLQRLQHTQQGRPIQNILSHYQKDLFIPLLRNQKNLETDQESFPYLIDLFLSVFLVTASRSLEAGKKENEEVFDMVQSALKDLIWMTNFK